MHEAVAGPGSAPAPVPPEEDVLTAAVGPLPTDSQQPDVLPVIDEALAEAFYTEHAPGLFAYLRRKAPISADAAELRDEVFLQFLAWWPRNYDHPNPRAVLYQLANWRLADLLKSSGRTLTFEADDLAEVLAREPGQDGFAEVEVRIDLIRALKSMEERDRQAMLLHYVAELTVADCAEVLGVGVNNMKKILIGARHKLRMSPGLDTYGIGRQQQKRKEVHQ
ncbi:RNA polymerase sigma factor [Streptomyces chartreusis]|uniref:RNA polymerase sigma factor n=1 Tax=Streptomyces chartreusis TaxID=1969 RepID=UPI0036FD4118